MGLGRPVIITACAAATSVLFLAVLSTLTCSSAWAREDVVPGSRYTSARGAALGDAYLPLVDDGASSLFYNPAGIGHIRQTHAEPINLKLQANSDYLSMLDRNFYKVTSLSAYSPTISGKSGKFPSMAASIFPNFYTRGFAFGILLQNEFGGQSVGTNIRYRSNYQLIPTVGTGIKLMSGIIRVGYSAQWVNQASGDVTVPLSSSPLGYNQGLNQGSALSHTAGIAITLPYTYLPQFNLVARNLLGARFGSFSVLPLAKNSIGVPATEPMTLDSSVSVVSKLGAGATMTSIVEYRDATNRSRISYLGRAAAGLEVSVRDAFFVRGGWGSGYPSAGFGLRRKKSDFSLAWYSEEVGQFYHSERNIRYILQYQYRAF